MAMEIERKFLVKDDSWRPMARSEMIRQGYLFTQRDRAMRIRIAGERAFLTIKQARNGTSRREYEYAIPLADALEMLDEMCNRPLIEKTRHTLVFAGREWIVDVFEGENAGLVVAEIELDREDQEFALPAWTGDEVTGEARYFNTSLSARPYRLWTTAERINAPGCP